MRLRNSICVTGAAGFIGFHLSRLLLEQNINVIGVDALTDYYDVRLKHDRLNILKSYDNFEFIDERIENIQAHEEFLREANTNVVVHLAAQAGVRYSIDNPSEYVSTNLVGTANLLELAKNLNVDHFLAASTSSVYGANTKMPFKETDKCDTQMSFYAATKKANEAMAHSYSHIFDLPVTMFRFFTVYGPWGRPDMALFKFAKKMLADEPIDVYNHGNMTRDFTYVVDLVQAISLLIGSIPEKDNSLGVCDSLSPVAPFRVVNIGNSEPTPLMDYINTLEQCLGIRAHKNFLEMQPGDVPATSSDCELLKTLTGFSPSTPVAQGVDEFVKWYVDYHQR